MAYILHYQGDNPNRIEEYIILTDEKPTPEDIEDNRISGYPEVEVHFINGEWPCSLPLEELLHKRNL